MEDRIGFLNTSKAIYMSLFDGHGGHEVADALQKELLSRVVAAHGHTFDPHLALVRAFGEMETIVDDMEGAGQCGSTAVVAMLTEDELVLANVGNSLALLCSSQGPLLLTVPHELSLNEEEYQRVTDQGGHVSDHRGKRRLENDLELSRSFGDGRYRDKGLVSTPEIFSLPLQHYMETSPQFLFLLLLSDGIVESLTYEEVCSQAKAQHLGLPRPQLSPPQPPPIVLSSTNLPFSGLQAFWSWFGVLWSSIVYAVQDLTGAFFHRRSKLAHSLPHCCDCSLRPALAECRDRPRDRSAQSVAERVSTQAFNRGSSDNLAVLALNLLPVLEEMVLPVGIGGEGLAYTLTSRLASLPSMFDPETLHGHQASHTSTPYIQQGFWDLMNSKGNDSSITTDAIGPHQAGAEVNHNCLGIFAGSLDGAVAVRDSLDLTCRLMNELAASSTGPSIMSSSEGGSRGLLSFLADDQNQERLLGSGSFGSVWRAKRERSGPGGPATFVIKKLDHTNADALESGEREAHFGRLLSKSPGGHRHIVKYIEHFYGERQPGGRDLYLVFLDAGKSLHDLMYEPGLSELSQHQQWSLMGPSDWWRKQRGGSSLDSTHFIKKVLFQLLTALDKVHSQGITHRDIKPENLMVDSEDRLRVIDFGSSLDPHSLERLYSRGSRLSSHQTTVEYSPPEELFGSRYWETMQEVNMIHPHAQASDVWAAGVVALELVLATPNVFELRDAERKGFEKKLKAAGKDFSSHRLLLRLRGLVELCIHPSMPSLGDGNGREGSQVSSVKCTDVHFGSNIKARDPLGYGLSDEGVNLVRRMLHWDGKKRITAREALNHSFFSIV